MIKFSVYDLLHKLNSIRCGMIKKLLMNAKERYESFLDNDNYEDLFYRIFLLVGIFMTFLTSLMNYFLGLSLYTVLLPIFSGVFTSIVHLLFYRKNRNLASVLIIANNNFFFSPFMWLTNSGFKGGFQYFLFLFLIISITVLKGTARLIIVTLYILMAFGLMLFEAVYPEIVLQLSEGTQNNMVDMIFSIVLSLFIVTGITFVLSNLYVHHQNKIRELTIKDPLTKQYSANTNS